MTKNQSGKNMNLALYLTVLYIFVNLTTAYIRFPFLDAISINKILPVSILIVISFSFANIKVDKKSIRFGLLLVLLYITMLCSYALSEYKYSYFTQSWLTDYWQQVFLFWFIYLSINNKQDARLFVILLVLLFGAYQIISWRDFLMGGSYVWQQGFKRMMGVWSGGGLGAANAWGFLSLFFFPLGYYLYLTAKNRKVKILTFGFLAISVLSVFFSGTRAALICLAVVILLISYKKIFQFKVMLLIVIISLTIHIFLPDSLKQRYLGTIYTTESIDSSSLSIAEDSAESRLQGLIDGWELFKIKPFFGWGPGASPEARTLVNNDLYQIYILEERYLQLHSLYGQLISELGLFGSVIFILLCFLCVKRLKEISKAGYKKDDYDLDILGSSLSLVLIATLVYGFAAHNLYKTHWYIIFGLVCAVYKVNITREACADSEIEADEKKI